MAPPPAGLAPIEPLSLHFDQLLFLLILAGGLYLFVTEKLRVDVTAMLLLLAMVVFDVLEPDQALSGFASERPASPSASASGSARPRARASRARSRW